MKKRRRFPFVWLVLLAGAVALEMVVVEGALRGDAPLSRVADGLRPPMPPRRTSISGKTRPE